jgi:predicted HicB family RNase H-like nuclease
MAKRTISPPAPPPGHDTKNISLRLPGKLSDLAQQCSESSGLSLNGLICAALADYLRERGYKVHSR